MTDLTCEEGQDLLGDFVAGELADAVVVVLKTHIAGCPGCCVQLELYRATICVARVLRQSDPHAALPPAFAERLKRMIVAES